MKLSKLAFYSRKDEMPNRYLDILKESLKQGIVEADDFYIDTAGNIINNLENMDLYFSNDYGCHVIMQEFDEKLESIYIKEIIKKIWVGVSDTSEKTNAKAMEEFCDESLLIYIDANLLYLLRQISELFASKLIFVFGYVNTEDLDACASARKLINLCYTQLVDTTFENTQDIDRILKSDLVSIREDFERILTDLYKYSSAFILAHEIGHHLLQHTRSRNKMIEYIYPDKSQSLSQSESKLDIYQKEYDADLFALRLMVNTYTNSENKLRRMVIYGILLSYICMAIKTDPLESYEKHPSVKSRYSLILSQLTNIFTSSAIYDSTTEIELLCQDLMPNYWTVKWW